jgi:hypothetical protein
MPELMRFCVSKCLNALCEAGRLVRVADDALAKLGRKGRNQRFDAVGEREPRKMRELFPILVRQGRTKGTPNGLPLLRRQRSRAWIEEFVDRLRG